MSGGKVAQFRSLSERIIRRVSAESLGTRSERRQALSIAAWRGRKRGWVLSKRLTKRSWSVPVPTLGLAYAASSAQLGVSAVR